VYIWGAFFKEFAMRTLSRLSVALALVGALVPGFAVRHTPDAAAERSLPAPNYDLASRWTSAKVGKYVFSTSVSPNWMEFSDRFWYSYETPAGMKWWIVDPVKKTKTPIWDNAKVAAQLTRILRTPYDAQHLPIQSGNMRFFDNDTKIRFSVSLPRDSKVETADGKEIDGTAVTGGRGDAQQGQGGGRGGGRGGGGRGGQQQGGRQGGAAGAGGGAQQTKQWWLEYDTATGNVVLNDKYTPEAANSGNPNWATVSPDKQTIVFARKQNLFMMDAANFELAKKNPSDNAIQETQLTTDGEPDYGFGGGGRGGGGGQQQQQQQEDQQQENTQTGTQGGTTTGGAGANQSEADKKFGPRTGAGGLSWSQDSKRFSLMRRDQRKVKDLWVINSLSNPRPTLETYKYGMPGEEEQPQSELWTVDTTAKKATKVKVESFKDQNLGQISAPITNLQRLKNDNFQRWITMAGDKLYYSRQSRDLKRVDIVEADAATGESRVIIPERLNTYIETQPLRTIMGGKQLIHWSERDGWGHYYLYDNAGKLIRQITQGEFVCTGIVGINETTRTLYFNAAGRETAEDPYYIHLYSVNIDTGAIKLLNPGNASHSVSMHDKATYFIDNSSRIDMAPESVLYDAAGTRIMDLEKTDVSALLAAGYKYPEAFQVKADDGITDIYGVMYKPFDFDPAKKYPIIEYVYPGPQTESVTKTFNPRNLNVALANVGFIVIEVGNRGGNPQRSKWYHNYGYGNLRDYGLADKKAAVEQLAKRYAWVDLTRVGIYGHSGGGFMTAAAMFNYPDFFKVGISESGNHDNSVYNRSWSEKHDGVKEVVVDDKVTFQYDIDKNQDIAKNLKGHILLITGDIDNNVHPAGTYRVIDALIRSNKRFDFILLPGQRHGYTTMGDYVYWRRIDYFSQWLLGSAPTDVQMLELDRERAMNR
jgi:dipeptidyl aminopeptidase/acylaminoacyl peptidase